MTRALIGLSTYVEPVTHGDWKEAAAFVPSTYVDAVDAAGGTPVLLPPSSAAPAELVAALDGLMVIGGPDVDPALYGAEPHPYTDTPRRRRDEWESGLALAALDADVPLLAICRGIQLLNVVLGGSLHQHVEEVVGHTGHLTMVGQMNPNVVTVRPHTKLASILPGEAGALCHHHQAVDRLGRDLVVTAATADGTVEAVEIPGKRFAIGVQWHPEEEPSDGRLFEAFVAAAREHQEAR